MKKRTYAGLFMLGITITGSAGQPETDINTILKNSAEYCERLKAAVFHCICKEYVIEIIKDQSGGKKQNTYLYDYQIISKKGEAAETRTRMRINGVSLPPKKNAKLETEFYSHLSIYAPVFMLARENQGQYRYRFLREERVKGVQTWVLDIEQLEARGIVLHGRIWVDRNDFSILCIDVNSVAMGGFQKKQENAAKWGAKLWLSDTHWYEVSRNGLRFPSKTEFYEKYYFPGYRPSTYVRSLKEIASIGPGDRIWNRSETSFTYTDYRFFQVQVDVKEHPLEK